MTGAYLIVVDVQNDFSPEGKLPVAKEDLVVAPINQATNSLRTLGVRVIYSRDFHPAVTNHFSEYGGEWPEHCVAGTFGAQLRDDLEVSADDLIVDKGTERDDPGYSAARVAMETAGITGGDLVLLCGWATDYCVGATGLELLERGCRVWLLEDAVQSVNIHLGDGDAMLGKLRAAGAIMVTVERAIGALSQGLELEL